MKKIILLLSLTGIVNSTFAQSLTPGTMGRDTIANFAVLLTGFNQLPKHINLMRNENCVKVLTEQYGNLSTMQSSLMVTQSYTNPGMPGNVFNGYGVKEPLSLARLTDTSISKSPKEMYNFYMQKRKTNYIAGFILLGSGVTIFSIGVVNGLEHILSNDERAGVLVITGGAIALISIPFLIAGRSNKRKAYLALRKEAAATSSKSSGYLNYAAISLKLQL